MQEKLPLPVGTTDYKKICRENYYVDKTLLIKDLLDQKTDTILFTRPRRFGKTLNMDMLRTFFEQTAEDTSVYFTDKNIWQQGEKYIQHQGQYPVIYISLKDIKSSDWNMSLLLLKKIIRAEYARHQELLNSDKISIADSDTYKKVIKNEADDADYMFSLHDLSQMLHDHHGKKPIIIIDEYDTPIQEGYLNGYYKEAISFIRNFFSAALKDNAHITMSILTGILRIAKESIFSGLNNIRVDSVLDDAFNRYFGFTDEEIAVMAAYYDVSAKLGEIKEWYDGYKFGDREIYNPWSVINYFSNGYKTIPYWSQTSENTIIHEILKQYNCATYENLQSLLSGKLVESVIKTNIIYPKLKDPQTNILGFLLMTGYLKATKTTLDSDGAYVCELAIPNKEIRTIYRNEIMSLLTDSVGEGTINGLKKALLEKNAEMLKKNLWDFMLKTISYYDGLGENYYHGLMLGLVTIFEYSHELCSNRESGDGRYDIQLAPKNNFLPGIIIEIKAIKKDSRAHLRKLAAEALAQIEAKKYDTELRSKGVSNIYKYGIAFCAKEVEIVTN